MKVLGLEHFQENACPCGGGGGIRFSVRKCDNAKMLERFLSPVYETALAGHDPEQNARPLPYLDTALLGLAK